MYIEHVSFGKFCKFENISIWGINKYDEWSNFQASCWVSCIPHCYSSSKSFNVRLLFRARRPFYEITHRGSLLTELGRCCVDYVGGGANLLDCSSVSYAGISIGTLLPEWVLHGLLVTFKPQYYVTISQRGKFLLLRTVDLGRWTSYWTPIFASWIGKL